jgi:hypothetical protein
VIDVSAGSGKCIVVRSRFTGRLLFTALYTLSWPALRQVGHGPSGRWLLEGARPLPSQARPPTCRSRAVDYKNLRPRLQTELSANSTMVQENCLHSESILRCSMVIVTVDQQVDKPVNIQRLTYDGSLSSIFWRFSIIYILSSYTKIIHNNNVCTTCS